MGGKNLIKNNNNRGKNHHPPFKLKNEWRPNGNCTNQVTEKCNHWVNNQTRNPMPQVQVKLINLNSLGWQVELKKFTLLSNLNIGNYMLMVSVAFNSTGYHTLEVISKNYWVNRVKHNWAGRIFWATKLLWIVKVTCDVVMLYNMYNT